MLGIKKYTKSDVLYNFLGKLYIKLFNKMMKILIGAKEYYFDDCLSLLSCHKKEVYDKPILVFLHGFNGNKEMWLRVLFYLKNYYGLIAVDLPGHGKSHELKNYQICSYEIVLSNFIKSIKNRKIIIVTSSMSYMIGCNILEKQLHNIVGHITLNPFGVSYNQIKKITNFIPNRKKPLVSKNMKEYEQMLSFIFLKKKFLPKIVIKYMASVNISKVCHIDNMFTYLIGSRPVDYNSNFKKVPTLNISGKNDMVVDISEYEELKNKKYFNLVWIDSCGHLPMLEKPKETALAINLFIVNSILPNEKY